MIESERVSFHLLLPLPLLHPALSIRRFTNLLVRDRLFRINQIRLTFLKDIAENDFLFESPSYEAEESIALKAKMVPQYRSSSLSLPLSL
jgi:hypothetical protein